MLHALILVAAAWLSPQQIDSGADVIRAMHDRYEGEWYTDLALMQVDESTRSVRAGISLSPAKTAGSPMNAQERLLNSSSPAVSRIRSRAFLAFAGG